MKPFFFILLVALACVACGPKPTPQATPTTAAKFQTSTLRETSKQEREVLKELHYQLVIDGDHVQIVTNVASIQEALNIIGQYGWELVQVEPDNGGKIYHVKRIEQPLGKFFCYPTK